MSYQARHLRSVGETSHRRRRIDATSALSVFVILLLCVPSQLIIGALGGAGTPAQIMGICMMGWWVADRVRKPRALLARPMPVRRAMVLFVGAVLFSFVAASTRAISDEELRSTQMGLLSVCAWFGVLCIAADGVPNRERLDVLLQRMVFVGGCIAVLGVLQFATGQSIVDRISIPGLTANSRILGVSGREGFGRPNGTAIHAIEFAAVLTMILPFAAHYAIYPRRPGRVRRWFPLAAICVAVPISISRSAIVCSAVVLAFLVPGWTPTIRRRACALLLILGALVYLLVPGLLGTIGGLFTGISSDSSALSRTGSYDLAWDFFKRSPITGRGFLTFLPSYRILDNQYLGTLIDLGLLGLGALLTLFVTGMCSGLCARRRAQDEATKDLGQACAAAVASGAVSFALFDAFSFPMAAATVFCILGCTGALFRLTSGEVAAAE